MQETDAMPINADKPHLWKADTRASVDQFNEWFMTFAPKAFRESRAQQWNKLNASCWRRKTLRRSPR